MLSRKILILVNILTALYILHDVYKIVVLRNNSNNKLEYLQNVHSSESIDVLYSVLLENFEIKEFKSLRNLLTLNPHSYDIKDSDQWTELVDKTDHEAFQMELDKIPQVNNSIKQQTLTSIRDSLIHANLLLYAIHKTSTIGGCYTDKYRLIKDIHHDIYLMNPRLIERLRFEINGQPQKGAGNSHLSAKSDSITVTSYQKIRPLTNKSTPYGLVYRDTIVHTLAI